MEKKFLYVYDVIEHERGWGCRPDGYMLFLDKQPAEDWVKEHYSNRDTGAVPNYYENYEDGRWHPVHESLFDKIKADGHGWVKDLNEVVKPTKTRKVELVWTLELEEKYQELTDAELFSKFFEDVEDATSLGEITIKG